MKKGTKTALIAISILFFWVLWQGAFQIIGMFTSIGEFEEAANADQAKIDKIRNSPILQGILVTNDEINAPFSNDKVALSLFQVGRHLVLMGSGSGGNTNKKRYDLKRAVLTSNETFLQVDGKQYPIDFTEVINAIQLESAHDSIKKHGYPGLVLNTKEYIFNEEEMNAHLEKNKKLLKDLKGKHRLIDYYLENCQKDYDVNIIVHEYNYRNGDTLSIYGAIENGKIVPVLDEINY